jgi:Kef-type K+ transport system membrane component KefB
LSDWLLALAGVAIVVAVAYAGAQVATLLRQPRIAGQFVAVVLIGPTVLGGRIDDALFPARSVDVLGVLGTVGLMLYMLLVGLTIDPAPLARRAGTIALLTISAVVSTVAVALVAGPWLRDAGGWMAAGAHGSEFVVALTAALVASGVPVVARILEERALLRTEVGAIVVTTSGLVTTLALVASGVAVKGGGAGTLERFGVILTVAALLVAVLVPLARANQQRLAGGAAVVLLLATALAAGIAGRSLLGTALLGPLVVGVFAEGGGTVAAGIERRAGLLVREVLLAIFLGYAALHTNLRELGPDLVTVAAILGAVTAARLAAGYGAGRLAGFGHADAGTIAAMLQCGGVMTIAISLAVLDADLITTRMNAALTLAGLATTVIAGPLMGLARRGRAGA